jgi:DNA-binding SARP family transcriptional activator
VSLTGDSWVDLGLALAIAAAAALVWRLRRRRYTPRPPSPRLRLDDPDLAPMPDVVTRVARGLREPEQDQDADLYELLDPPARDVPDADLGAVAGTEPDAVAGQDLDAHAAPPLNVPALGNPILAAWPPAGLGLTGPGAEAAGRGMLAAALAAGGVDDPDARSCVVMPAATAATLLGAAAVNMPDSPRLTVTGDLAQALELLEEQTQYRTRILYDNEVDTVTGLREANPLEEPLPPMILIADAAAGHERARIAALLIQGQRLDIHGVLLGVWPDGNTTVVAADGSTTPADGDAARHGAHPADVARLAVLSPTETAELIATLAESHTGRSQPAPRVETPGPQPAATTPAPSRPDPHDEKAPNDEKAMYASPGSATSAETSDAEAPTAHDPATAPVLVTVDATRAAPDGADGDETAGDGEPPNDVEDDNGDRTDHDEQSGHVEVLVLGPPRIIDMYTGEPFRPQALELLVHLIAHDGAASRELILDDAMAAAPHRKAPHRLNTYVYNLRRILRLTGGEATYVDRSHQRFWLNTDAIGVDLWRMRDAVAEAQAAIDPDTRVAALRRAVDAYRGPLADGCDYEWIAPYREAVLQQAIDAHVALADALAGQPMDALAVLEKAIGHAPYAEPLYVKAMRIHADLGHTDAIRTLRRALTRRLAETDAEPADETITLADQLVSAAQRRRPRRPDGAAA